MAQKSKLHEILAVEKDLENVAKNVISEGIITFTKKSDHFTGMLKILDMFDENRQKEADALKEHKELVTTVDDKISYITKAVVKYFDTIGKKEATNQVAIANLNLDDGTEIVKDVPATLLLGLESRLKRVRELYAVIPTLSPGVEWIVDTAKGDKVFKTKEPIERNKTEKKIEYKIVVPVTKEHPAQIREWAEDKPIGKFITIYWSGAITPARKSVLLSRLDEVIRCVKKARTRANCTEVQSKSVGKAIFSYINS